MFTRFIALGYSKLRYHDTILNEERNPLNQVKTQRFIHNGTYTFFAG
jgi:hypothetical protein